MPARKRSQSTGLEAASRRWTTNADEIAVFLSAANPANWRVDDLKRMMRHHLDQALAMADALSAGILKQFPQKVM